MDRYPIHRTHLHSIYSGKTDGNCHLGKGRVASLCDKLTFFSNFFYNIL